MYYIAFLRAINVGGHTVTMETLRGLFSDLGFENVRSYIQTGNVFFESPELDREKLSKKIQDHLRNNLGYEVGTIISTLPELEEILQADPFASKTLQDDTRHCVICTSSEVTGLTLPYLTKKQDVEVICVFPGALCAVLHLKDGKPGNSNTVIEKEFGVTCTTRFYHTFIKIVEAARQIS